MTQMAHYVYEMYVKKLKTVKDKLPAKAVDTEMYANIPTEECAEDQSDDNQEEENEMETMEVYEPPAKKPTKEVPAKEKPVASAKTFKPTPIVNEIDVDDEEDANTKESKSNEGTNEE